MGFGEQLRLARKNAGLTQKQLADAVGAKHNSVSNWEKGQNQPDAETIQRLCRALKVEANHFFDAGDGLSEVEFALFGEVRQLSEADQRDVLEFIRFKRAQQEKREGK
ncbi:MAG: helix-turn-helix transcriptional regulator [Clostridia bacterium]|jgi:Predicted transcriptional regulators|nr:helix-turn-helix transcriptional regulator [Clostridia bacterium]